MIPQFPEFKQLALSDKTDVEAVTHKFPPYSDFEFASLYAWDVQEQTKISQDHGNLIIRFTDYITGDFFYTFIGDNDVNNTAEKLLELSKTEGREVKLKLVPEETAKLIDTQKFSVSEDRDNFDYLIPIALLKNYDTAATYSRRKSVRKFLEDFSEHTLSPLDLQNQQVVERIQNVIIQSNKEHPERGLNNELLAITRLLKDAGTFHYITLGVFLDDVLVAFVICDIAQKNIVMGHFIKALRSVSAHLYSFLLNRMGHMLDTKGCTYLNFEQDLGLEGLRKWKTSFGSTEHLKKYIVTLANMQ